jgi:hypothetical protein
MLLTVTDDFTNIVATPLTVSIGLVPAQTAIPELMLNPIFV